MTVTITCDTTPGGDGNIHAVVFVTDAQRDPAVWDDVVIGDTIGMVDQTTGVASNGTIADIEVSRDTVNPTATRVELVITPE